ncbi:MAG: 1-phosphofructokinase [bacterium]|nr:1-phosphofructokinase [bacterium]
MKKILTITLNPAIDTRYCFDSFQMGEINRVSQIGKYAGGKGLNVSKVLTKLKTGVLATGFLGGKTGELIAQKAEKSNIDCRFVLIEGESRVCIAIINTKTGIITEILESGPSIKQNEKNIFLNTFINLVKDVDVITISGSIPKGLPDDFYCQLVDESIKLGKKVILDSSGIYLKKAIKSGPFLIKPNIEEFEYLTNKQNQGFKDLLKNSKFILDKGVKNILLTLGGDGALFISKEKRLKLEVPKVIIKNSVGSGDATLAGFAYGVNSKLSIVDSIKYALACGTSNAMLNQTGDIDLDIVEDLADKIVIKEID